MLFEANITPYSGTCYVPIQVLQSFQSEYARQLTVQKQLKAGQRVQQLQRPLVVALGDQIAIGPDGQRKQLSSSTGNIANFGTSIQYLRNLQVRAQTNGLTSCKILYRITPDVL